MTKDYEMEEPVTADDWRERMRLANEWNRHLLERCGSVAAALEVLDKILAFHGKPSEPAGATMTANPGVGTGEEEKVAQEGCERLRAASSPEGIDAILMLVDPGPGHAYHRFPHQDSGEECLVGGHEPPCIWCSRCKHFIRPENMSQPCTPPAPPDTAPAAEETSSGGERCGSTTAEGACCEPRRLFLQVFGSLRHAGEEIDGIGPFLRCPWCSSPLQPPTKVSPPRGESTPFKES